MKLYRIFTLALLCLIALPFMAQDTYTNTPDLQVAQQEFFDPTRKEKEVYQFSTTWRLEAGYVQDNQKQDTSSLYFHGMRLGATVDFNLPYHFSIQTGLLASFAYGLNSQHWALAAEEDVQINTVDHNLLQLQLIIPARAYYNITLWKQLRLFFYAGPQLQLGLMSYDIIQTDMAPSTMQWYEQQGLALSNHDRYAEKQLYRTNIQFGLGGGLEWDKYRLQSGYDFGLNNIYRERVLPGQKLNTWGWHITFSYSL